MKYSENIERVIKASYLDNIETSADSETDKKILGDALAAMKNAREARSIAKRSDFRRIIMKHRITKLAVAASIVVAALIAVNRFVGPIDVTGKAWAELVQKVEQSHNGYYAEFLLAIEGKDAEKTGELASTLSEFWQGVGLLAEARVRPELQARLEESINFVRSKTDEEMERSEQIFLAHAEQFTAWLDKIEDPAWINETVHVCKQMEEYAEEIRDAARSSELGFTHIEHCLPSFIAYCQWFEQLPWDDPEQHVDSSTLLSGIQRDLEIARREIEHMKIGDADRYVKRCIQQSRANVSELASKISSSETESQWNLCRRLSRKIDALSDLIVYVVIASWDTQQIHEIEKDEALLRVLTREFAGKGPLQDYLNGQIDQSVGLCRQLAEELEPVR
ncbi:MAG: hypothetical protein ACYS8Z_24515 [Planctomycetota bacterium]|jgi:hypothetical protein